MYLKNLFMTGFLMLSIFSMISCYENRDKRVPSKEHSLSPTEKLLKKGISEEELEESRRTREVEKRKAEQLKWQRKHYAVDSLL